MLKLFNTLTRKKEIFRSIKDKFVGLYSCGPTVYNFVHIGNLRAYIFVDLLKRYLKYNGYKVKHVMNITDVDDKTIKGSIEKKQSLAEYTEFYLHSFIDNLKDLNILLPDKMPRATKHIAEMVNLVAKLKEEGYAYDVNGSIYFKISKFKNYGKLARLNEQFLKRNIAGRLRNEDDYDKDQATDFVLWKAWQPEDGNVFWDTKIGRGRPGWHIECSAMSMKYLGGAFDIHTGGVDLIFPHHTNEIAQSEAVTGKRFVNYWLHNAHLKIEGERMGKSLGNFYTLNDLLAKGFDPLLLRIALMKVNYTRVLDFKMDDLEEAKAIASRFIDFLVNIDNSNNDVPQNNAIAKKIADFEKEFKNAMDDNLNISSAFATLFRFMNEISGTELKIGLNDAQKKEIKNFLMDIDAVFGFIKIFYERYQKRLKEIMDRKEIVDLLLERKKEREGKNFNKADEIREKLLDVGIIVIDQRNKQLIKLRSML